jgi:TolA-binding protein
LSSFRQARRNQKWFAAGAAAALALFLAGLATLRFKSEEPASNISYRVDGRAPPIGGYVLTSQSAESLLSFSDGSKLTMATRSRGRVVDVTAQGARFALEEGALSAEIVHGPRARWSFEAGPFLVTVHGTSFTIAWNPAAALFEMRLRDGAVSVATPIGGPLVHLRAGQTLRVSLHDQTSTLGTLGGDVTPRAPSSSYPPGAAASNHPTQPFPAPSASGTAPGWSHRKWSNLLAEGKALTVVAQAERLGLDDVLQRADGDDLWGLANAARYASRHALAEQALMAQRKRFPSSQRAQEAAFFLGRLHDGDAAGPGAALTWYERYLVEAPRGVHASDALGRKMTLLERWNRRPEALTVAGEYLRRFPDGTYAKAARVLHEAGGQ